MQYGYLAGGLGVLGLLVACAPLALLIPVPSDRLFESAAQIGATLLIAFAVEIGWVVKESDRQEAQREEWVGFVSSLGSAGFSGILVSLALVEHLSAGHENWLDRFGFAWVLASLLLLGIFVAIQPATTYAWRRGGNLD
jgi:hypothetical protein